MKDKKNINGLYKNRVAKECNSIFICSIVSPTMQKKSPASLAGHKKVFNLKKIKSKTILLQTWWHSCQF